MIARYSLKDWDQFQKNIGIIRYKAINLIDKNTGEEALWNCQRMYSKIKEHMNITNGDWDFSWEIDPISYLAAQLKFIKNKDVINLLVDFYKYEECDYNAEIYGTKIIDYCNQNGCSYIISIYYLAMDNNDFDEDNYYFVPIHYLYRSKNKMRWARLNENGEVYYIEPKEEPPCTKETIKKAIEYFKNLGGK